MTGKWKFFVDQKPWLDARSLFMTVSGRDGAATFRAFVNPLVYVRVDPSQPYEIPTLSENGAEAQDGVGDVTGFLQAALDAAWELGMRPLAFSDHTQELTAVRYHLEDMRTLAKLPKVQSA